MQPGRHSDAVRQASGLPHLSVLTDPVRVTRVRRITDGAAGSAVLPALVRLASKVASSDCAQLSLLTDEQIATAVRCNDSGYSRATSALADSLCSVTVLSGDVLVAADAKAHPWLLDLPPVVHGAVRNYLGVPLLLDDGTAVGALCVYGPEPREWSDRDVGLTCDVADVVALELRRLVGQEQP
jgi:GAF domain-containing protein